MSAILIVVFLSLNMGKSGGAIRPVVTFEPNWGNVLQDDEVTLRCNVPSPVLEEPRTYHWYKDNRPIPGDQKNLHIISGVPGIGDYQCRVSAGDISDPVTLNVTNTYVILQRPPSTIYEGDPLTLRCHHIKEYRSFPPRYYKNNKEIKSQFPELELHIQKVNLSTAGHYKCSKIMEFSRSSTGHEFSDEFFLSVKELFSPPEIKVTPSRVIEGGEMTVTCDTRLDPLRGGTELHFAFCRDGRTVREFNVSDTYRVRSAQLEDSGNYTCKVRTTDDTVRKRSDELHIQIHGRELFVTILAVTIVGVLLLIVLSAVLIWRCKNRKGSSASSQGSPQGTATTAITATDENPDPQDVCYTYLELNHLREGTKIRNDEMTVTYATVKNPNI